LDLNQRPFAYQTNALPPSYEYNEGSRTWTHNADFEDQCFTF
jgi:hypothetical protein